MLKSPEKRHILGPWTIRRVLCKSYRTTPTETLLKVTPLFSKKTNDETNSRIVSECHATRLLESARNQALYLTLNEMFVWPRWTEESVLSEPLLLSKILSASVIRKNLIQL